MFEFVPFAVAAVFGALISRSRLKTLPLLFAVVVVAIGFFATLESGEYASGWMMLPNDVALATLGAIFGIFAARMFTRAYRLRL